MAVGTLGSFNGTVTPNVNMLDTFKANELAINPNSTLKYGNMVVKKIGISAPASTTIEINGTSMFIPSGIFELDYGQVDIYSLKFVAPVVVQIYYLF
jgi:hypothetical protein